MKSKFELTHENLIRGDIELGRGSNIFYELHQKTIDNYYKEECSLEIVQFLFNDFELKFTHDNFLENICKNFSDNTNKESVQKS